MNRYVLLLAATSFGVCAGCTRHKLDINHNVEPIHITMDINLKIQSDLDAYFAAADAAEKAALASETEENE